MESVTASSISIIFRPASIVERVDLSALFPKSQPLEVELGAGDGSFIAQWAKMNPQHNFIGVERLLGRLRKIERKAQRAGLTNLRALRIEASYLIEYLLPCESVSAVHIYFPDPWPKRKHRKNRLVNERFTEILRSTLWLGGSVFLRTDDEDYFAQMLAVFAANNHFEPIDTPEELTAVETDFEREFKAKGIHPRRAAYRRKE